MLDLSISIVHFNSKNKLKSCLSSIYSQKTQYNYRVWVVDNFSYESIREYISEFSDTTFVFNKENVGYGRGNNQIINNVAAKYHLVLNPDVVMHEGCIERMLNFMENHTNVAILGPKMIYEDGTLQYSCRRFPTLATFLMRGLSPFLSFRPIEKYLMKDVSHAALIPVDWNLGSCLLIRKKVYDELGGFDERYFMYYEDIDLCYRAHRSGYEVVYFPDAVVTHQYRRDSAKITSVSLKLFHTASAIRFFWSHLAERRLKTFL